MKGVRTAGKTAKEIQMKFNLETFDEELDGIISDFGNEGRIFSNEEQFQFELALEIERKYQKDEKGYPKVRLEVLSCPKDEQIQVAQMDESQKKDKKIKKMYTDIVIDIDDVHSIAIELKYKTWADNKDKRIEYSIGKNTYVVFHQGAPNIGCYQYLEDVARLEELVGIANQKHEFDSCNSGTRKVVCGFAIIITNDETYWKGPQKLKESVMEPFFLIEKDEEAKGPRRLNGELKNPHRERKENSREYKLHLGNHYVCAWKDYYCPQNVDNLSVQVESAKKKSKRENSGHPKFRYLLFKISSK